MVRLWISLARKGLSDEVYVGLTGDDAALVAHGEYLADSFAAIVAVVQGALVDVHADEAVGEVGIEVAGELHGIFQRGLAVVHGMLNAGAQSVGGDALHLSAERAADSVASKRQRQAGLLMPPYAKVEDLLQAVWP